MSRDRDGGGSTSKKSAIGSLNFLPPIPEPVVIHSSVVIVMIRLIPSVFENNETKTSPSMEEMNCQLFCASLVKSLVRSEKNQQLMSQAGLTEEILEYCSNALSDENHILHAPIHYAFERVASHCLTSKDLRYNII